MNKFMESLATNSTIKKVLAIYNSVYANKANSCQVGVGTESEIILQDLQVSAQTHLHNPD